MLLYPDSLWKLILWIYTPEWIRRLPRLGSYHSNETGSFDGAQSTGSMPQVQVSNVESVSWIQISAWPVVFTFTQIPLKMKKSICPRYRLKNKRRLDSLVVTRRVTLNSKPWWRQRETPPLSFPRNHCTQIKMNVVYGGPRSPTPWKDVVLKKIFAENKALWK